MFFSDSISAADENTVSPAGEVVLDTADPESFQLTDDVLAALADQELSNITLFQFGDETEAAKKRSLFDGCKTYPGDLLWPTKGAWKVFNLLTGNALIETVPIGAVCYESHSAYDQAKCEELLAHWTESATQ